MIHRVFPWDFGTIVYLRICDEPDRGMITGYAVKPEGVVCFVTWSNREEKLHYPFELSTEFVPEYTMDCSADIEPRSQ